jgi:hypothetical protein
MIWNPRYVCYAKAHGNTPEQQMEQDRTLWPGGLMCGFILWIDKRKAEFREVQPEAFLDCHIYDQAAWDKFLKGSKA